MLGTLARLHPIRTVGPTKGFYRANRKLFLEALQGTGAPGPLGPGYLLFKGPIEQPVYDDDNGFLLVPESNFGYLFGMDEPHTWGLIDLQNGRATLLVQEADPHRSYWMKVRTFADMAEEFEGEAVASIKDLPALIGFSEDVKDAENGKNAFSKKLWTMEGVNPDTLAALHVPTPNFVFGGLSAIFASSELIYSALRASRRNKSDEEVQLLLHAADVNAKVATALLAYLEPDKTELQLAHHFGALAMYFGNFAPAFNVQIAFGEHSLRQIHSPSKLRRANSDEFAGIDVGIRVNGLCSRLVRTLPVSGTFTESQRSVFDQVAGIYRKVQGEIKAKTSYAVLAKVIEEHLVTLLVELKVVLGGVGAKLTPETLRKFYEDDFLSFIGFDPVDPMTSDLNKDHSMVIEGQTAVFFKLAIRFDPRLIEGDASVDQQRVAELSRLIPAVKFGDLVIISEGKEASRASSLPVDSKRLENAIRQVAQSIK